MKENFSIENLIKIGLIESEAKIYLNLLKKKSFTASEISRLSEISRSKTYEILNQLVQKGLCVEILGTVKKYASANPKTAFNGLQQKLQQELENKKILISNLSETLLPLYLSEKENTDPLDYIQVIRERSVVMQKYTSLMNITKEEILIFTKTPFYFGTTENDQTGLNLLNTGIKAKSIYEVGDVIKQDYFNNIEMFMKAGEEARIVDELPMKMVIFDKKIVLCILKNTISNKNLFTTLIIEHKDFAKSFVKLFEAYWQNSMTLEEFKIKGV